MEKHRGTASDRSGRANSILRELAASFIRDEANTSPLITVTGVSLSADSRSATVRVTVFPDSKDSDALIFLKRKGRALREYMKKHAHLKTVPSFEFVLDSHGKNVFDVQQ